MRLFNNYAIPSNIVKEQSQNNNTSVLYAKQD